MAVLVSVSVRRLLSLNSLGLRLLTPESEALERSICWVHSSDLADPAPYLSEGDALLTTGAQFLNSNADGSFAAYVSRLEEAGVPALGFGPNVLLDDTPPPLVEACHRAGLTLFEVPFRTPFIAVARTVADIIADERYARKTWALGAQRAISLAALHPDGLSSTLNELAQQLGQWVVLFNTNGDLLHMFPRDALHKETLRAVQDEARRLLHRGQRASARIALAGETQTLQTLGRSGQLRGVLALGGSVEIDQASEGVITSVIALACLALEQNRALGSARSHLRSGLLHALISGDTALVESTSREMWGPLPLEPLRIAALDVPGARIEALTEALELRAENQRGEIFYALQDGVVIVCVAEGQRQLINELCRRYEAHCGVSDSATYRAIGDAVDQATRALERARESGENVVEFAEISQQGVLAFLAHTDAREIAKTTLAKIVAHDTEQGTELLFTLQTWLGCNAEFAAAARLLHINRHTVRARIEQVEQLLQHDLSSFHARADVWAALIAVHPGADGRPRDSGQRA